MTTGSAQTLNVAPAVFAAPVGLAIDILNKLYVSDTTNNTIYSVDLDTGSTSIFAGMPGSAGSQDGTSARFNQPGGLLWFLNTQLTIIHDNGHLYIADTGNATFRTNGIVTLAGSASVRGNQDGVGTAASFSAPAQLAVTASGTF